MGLFSAINEKKYLNEIAELKKQAEEQQEKIDELQNGVGLTFFEIILEIITDHENIILIND